MANSEYRRGKQPKEEVYPKKKNFMDAHPSQETRHLFPDDERLRSHGFHIVSRPRTGDNLWGLGKDCYGRSLEVMPEAEAFELCLRLEEEFEQAK